MARLALALFLTVAVLSTGTYGYELQSAKGYFSRLLQKASSFIRKDSNSYSAKEFICEKDGLFWNPSDCGTYILCQDGEYSIVKCPNGKHFSNATQWCEEPCIARCDRSMACECGWDSCTITEQMSPPASTEFSPVQKSHFICAQDGLYPNLMNCKKYFQCTSGQSYVMSCPEGLHFSPLTQRCESPCVAQCDFTINCRWKSSTDKKSSVSQSVPAITCTNDGLYHHPKNCSSYIQCSNGQKYVLACPSGLHFNEDTHTCERPCDAHCDDSIAEECDWEETTTPENDFDVCRQHPYTGPCDNYVTRYYFDINKGTCKTFRYGGCHSNGNNFKSERECTIKCLRADTFIPTESPSLAVCIRDGLFHNPEDCSTYIQCSNGQNYVMPCPSGLHFSEESGRCEAPCNAHCDNSIADECNWEDTISKSFKSPVSQAPFENACFKEGLFPNPENCNSYFQCSDGLRSVMKCPENRHFSQETLKCESACEAHCNPTMVEECGWETKEYAIIREDIICIKNELQPNPEDCSTYVQCWKGQGYIMSCPKGLHFSPQTQRCQEPCEAHCYAPMAEQCGWKKGEFMEPKPYFESLCRGGGVYPRHQNPENCSTYIQCSRGHGYSMNCPFGMHFSELTLNCETPCKAFCDPNLSQPCGWAEKSYSLKQPVFDFTCLKNGLFENHADCGSFIQCTGGSAYLVSCTFGLHFNPTTKNCESPCEAKCDLDIEERCQDDMNFGRYPKIPGRNSPTKQAHLYHENTCSEEGVYQDSQDCGKYIQCSAGHSYVIHCPGGLHFSRNTRRCDPPCDAHCDPTIADRCGWDHKAYAQRKLDFKVCKPSERYAFPGDCTRYVQCTEMGTGAYVMACPEGLHFSGFFCEEPCKAKCDTSLADTCHWNKQAVLSSTDSYFTTTSPDDSTGVVDFMCGVDGLYKNLDDCTTYYRCYSGQAYVRSCPNGLHYSELTQRCESQCDAHCNLTLACECDWQECSTKGKTTQESVGDECHEEPDAGPCQDKKTTTPTPPLPRYYYDAYSGRCRSFDFGGCGGNRNNFETLAECNARCTDQLLGGFRCPENNGKFGDYPDCTSYYDCKRGVPTLKRCPKGTAFDHLKAKCVTEYKATCVYQCREPDAVYPYDSDCHKYIDCVNGVPKVEKCPLGTAFDPSKRDCVDSEYVSC